MSAPAPPSTRSAPAPRGAAARIARGLAWAGVGLCFVAGLSYLALRYYVWPRVDDWRPQVTERLSSLVGRPVAIGRIESGFEGLLPRLVVTDVSITDDDGSPALAIPRLTAVLSARSLLTRELRLAVLQVESPRVRIERRDASHLRVAGVEVPLEATGGWSTLDRLLGQRRVLVRDAVVEWIDRGRGVRQRFNSLDLALGGVGRRHRCVLWAGPAGAAWERLNVALEWHRPAGAAASDWRAWTGEAFVGVDGADWAAAAGVLPLPTDSLVAARGALRLWYGFDGGRPRDGLLKVDARDAQAVWSGRTVRIARLNTEVAGKPDAGAFDLRVRRLDLQDAEGFRLTGLGEQALTLDASGTPIGGRASLAPFDAAEAVAFARRLPLDEGARERLEALHVAGQIRALSLRWRHAPRFDFEAAVDFERASLRYAPPVAGPIRQAAPSEAQLDALAEHWPWFEQISGEVRIGRRAGELRVHAGASRLGFPGIFEQPAVALDELKADAKWSVEDAGASSVVKFELAELKFANADAAGTVSGTYSTGGKGPGIVDLKGTLQRADVRQAHRYLPLQIPPGVRQWVAASVVAGTSDDVRWRARGDLHDFPFRDPQQGEFMVDARLRDAVLRYAPDWPAIERIDGNLVFERAGMKLAARTGSVFGVALSNTHATIRDFSEALLRIEGVGEGPAQDMIRFVNQSPVATRIDDFTRDTSVRGPARLQMRLSLPLEALERSRVAGSVQFLGNDVTLDTTLPRIEAVRGTLEFSDQGLAVRAMTGTLFGGPLRVDGETPEPGRFVLRADGAVTADGMRSAVDNSLTRALSGRAAYRASVDVRRRAATVSIESDLEGLGSSLPAPFDKPAAARWPMRVSATPVAPASPDARAERDTIRFSVRESVQMVLERRRDPKTERFAVQRGVLAVDGEPVMPDAGFALLVKMPRVDVDAWAALLRRGEAAREVRERLGGDPDDEFALMPNRLSLVADRVVVAGKELNGVVLGASRSGGFWRANVEAREVEGFFSWRQAPPGQGIGSLQARFRRLEIPKSRAGEFESLLAEPPSAMPALDIAADEFVLGDLRLGTLAVRAVNSGGAMPSWTLEQLRVVHPAATLDARGTWAPRARGAGRTTELDFELTLEDSGRLLNDFGLKNVLRGGAGTLGGRLHWNGTPMAIDYPSLGGEMKLALGRGQFLKADPGIAKLIGVLNLQSLPRRLALDFRDVIAEGFAFDEVSGDVRIDRGIARTDALMMRGVNAQVRIRGEANIAEETQVLDVRVRPNINAGLATIAAGAVINPVLGLGALVAQVAVGEPLLGQVFTYEYDVTGSWTDPQVVERRRVAEPAPKTLP